ncbi:MAG: hypothetical protein OCD02_23660 [Spirochaetaceae bacterium]
MFKKISWSIYVGFSVYCIISLFSGSVGFSNMRALDYFKANMITHVEVLQMKSAKLEDEIHRLSNDEDRLKLAVRPIGYIESGQSVVKILNNKVSKSLYEIDRQFDTPIFEQNTNRILLVSTMFSAILFIISLLVGVLRDTFKRK